MIVFALELSIVVFTMLINVKMPTIVGIFTFMSMINLMLSWFEHEKSLITLRPDHFRYSAVKLIYLFTLAKS